MRRDDVSDVQSQPLPPSPASPPEYFSSFSQRPMQHGTGKTTSVAFSPVAPVGPEPASFVGTVPRRVPPVVPFVSPLGFVVAPNTPTNASVEAKYADAEPLATSTPALTPSDTFGVVAGSGSHGNAGRVAQHRQPFVRKASANWVPAAAWAPAPPTSAGTRP